MAIKKNPKEDLSKLTRKQLAEELHKYYMKDKTIPAPIGAKRKLSKDEFVKRYLRGVGGTPGFKKDELIYLLSVKKSKKNRQ